VGERDRDGIERVGEGQIGGREGEIGIEMG
jgi:hypothetical protein